MRSFSLHSGSGVSSRPVAVFPVIRWPRTAAARYNHNPTPPPLPSFPPVPPPSPAATLTFLVDQKKHQKNATNPRVNVPKMRVKTHRRMRLVSLFYIILFLKQQMWLITAAWTHLGCRRPLAHGRGVRSSSASPARRSPSSPERPAACSVLSAR